VAAVFALELAAAHLESDWGALRFAVEWACALLRKGRPSAPERVWHLAVVALAGGARDDRLLIWLPPHSSTDPMIRHRYTSFVHADHAARRFPNEIRFQVADAFANELPGFHEPKRDAPGWISQQQRERGEAAIGRWKRFVDDPAVGAEAHLRIGHIYYCLANPRAAAVHYQSALQASRDPYVRYLAHFFIARMFEASGRPQDAAAAYRQALDVLPGVQSATMALAAATFLDQKPSGAYALMSAVFDGRPRPPDPWRLYDYGDYRLWPDLIARLRAAIRP
jgi:tetratricopeptide (TPR) repeat protein